MEDGDVSNLEGSQIESTIKFSKDLITSGKSAANVAGDYEWEQSKASLKRSTSTKLTSGKSITQLEEKFKGYISQDELLIRTLSQMISIDTASEDFCDSLHLLERNTESFRCLAQLLLSSSSLAKNRLFLFPPLEDPGIDMAFNFKEPPPENDDIGVEKYKKHCRDMDIVPISRIINSLHTDTLNLKYYGLTEKQITALTEALKANAYVQTLILQDNWLTVDMTQMISDMVVENTSLQHLSLYECRIGEEGAKKLGENLSTLQTLKSLDLSFNELGDNGLLALKDGLCGNTSLKKLNISHNNITEDSAEAMEKILLENRYIEDLDLSWNSFFTAQGNKKLFSGFLHSDRIKILNLAWNGIGIVPAVRPMVKYLKNAEHLEELNLSNNRLAGRALMMVRGAINKNHFLKVLKIGNNIYAPAEAHSLLTMIAGKTRDPLYYLDMENMYINKDSKVKSKIMDIRNFFKRKTDSSGKSNKPLEPLVSKPSTSTNEVLNKIKHLGKMVNIGGILSNYVIHGPDPKKLIYERCRYILMKPKKAKARKDFGHFILSLPDQPISLEDFQKELKKQKIKKLDKDLVQAVGSLFMNKRKQVECKELVNNYMTYYPDTKLPPPKPKKGKKGGKKGKKGKEKEEQATVEAKVESPEEIAKVQHEEVSENVRKSKISIQEHLGSPKEVTKETTDDEKPIADAEASEALPSETTDPVEHTIDVEHTTGVEHTTDEVN